MLVVIVHVHVKNEFIGAFSKASVENAANSLNEEGLSLFDVIQENEDPSRFVLLEVYRDEAAAKAHKDTAHYKKWRAAVEEMMAEPRYSVKYHDVFPPTEFWQKK